MGSPNSLSLSDLIVAALGALYVHFRRAVLDDRAVLRRQPGDHRIDPPFLLPAALRSCSARSATRS